MVDFNNDATVSTPPGDVVKIVVLERREQVIEALEAVSLIDHMRQDTSHKEAVLHARLLAFWYQVQAMVYRRLAKAKGSLEDPTYTMVEKRITTAKTKDEMVEAFQWMNCFVDDMGLTFIDTREKYDRTHVEDANTKKRL